MRMFFIILCYLSIFRFVQEIDTSNDTLLFCLWIVDKKFKLSVREN